MKVNNYFKSNIYRKSFKKMSPEFGPFKIDFRSIDLHILIDCYIWFR